MVDEPDKPWSVGVPLEKRSVARDLFMEGNRLMRVPLPARAAEKYSAALALWKNPVFYFNLAVAQIALGQEVEARENLEHALAYGEKPFSPEKYQEILKQLRDVKRQLGQIRVRCRTPGAEVTLDGVTLFIGPGSYQGWTKAKSYALTAKKAGYLAEARRVTVSPDQVQDIELKLITLSEATDTSRRWAVWKPWVVVAAGGVIAATGGVLHAVAARNFDDFDREFLGLPCAAEPDPLSPGCAREQFSPDLSGQLVLARRQQMIAIGAYLAGGSLVTAGVVLLYLNRPRLGEQRGTALTAQGVSIMPEVFDGGLGITVRVGL